MRCILLLILGAAMYSSTAETRQHPRRDSARHHAAHGRPAQQMLNTLASMGNLLNTVQSKATADNAAPALQEMYQQYQLQRNAAEEQPMTNAALNHHLAQMDKAMNNFRLACARLMQEKFYGSAQLGRTVRKIAKDF